VAYILSKAQPDGGIYVPNPERGGAGLGNYNTSLCMMGLHATGRKDVVPAIQKARAYTAATQLTGDDEHAVRAQSGQNPFLLGHEQARNQVGADQRVLPRAPAGHLGQILPPKADIGGYSIPARIGTGNADSLGIKVKRVHWSVPELGGGAGQNAGPGADIQTGPRLAGAAPCHQLPQTKGGRRVSARAEA